MSSQPNARKDLEEKSSPNIQENFLNTARRERSQVTIYLMSGVKLSGRIGSFDKFSLTLESGHQEQLIFKHAISTISLSRGNPGAAGTSAEEG